MEAAAWWTPWRDHRAGRTPTIPETGTGGSPGSDTPRLAVTGVPPSRFAGFRAAIAMRSSHVPFLAVDPDLAPLHDHPDWYPCFGKRTIARTRRRGAQLSVWGMLREEFRRRSGHHVASRFYGFGFQSGYRSMTMRNVRARSTRRHPPALPKPVSLFALLVLCFAGCTYGPTETLRRVQNVALKPDGTRVAVLVKIQSYRPATGLAAFPNGGVPKMLRQEAHLYVVDLVSPAVEQRIQLPAPRQHRNAFDPWLIGWDGDSVYMRIRGCTGEPGDECWGPLVTSTILKLQQNGDLVPASDVPTLRLAERAEGPNGYIEVHKEGYGVSVATRIGGNRVPLLEFEGIELRLKEAP